MAELSFVRAEKVLLSPHKVMLDMSDYIPNFNLTSQQEQSIFTLACRHCTMVLRLFKGHYRMVSKKQECH
ncbi:hypothetical protein K1719_034749 [Acacia pycnantha]|nr:hypothetical protein K1719_034749 [Acacia pycnantha]